MKNFNIAVKEWNDEIIFLRKLVAGGTNRSYGIQVARLAGIPPRVIGRAKKILADIEQGQSGLSASVRDVNGSGASKHTPVQLDLFRKTESVVVDKLQRTDLSRMTPIEALNFLNELQKEIKSKP